MPPKSHTGGKVTEASSAAPISEWPIPMPNFADPMATKPEDHWYIHIDGDPSITGTTPTCELCVVLIDQRCHYRFHSYALRATRDPSTGALRTVEQCHVSGKFEESKRRGGQSMFVPKKAQTFAFDYSAPRKARDPGPTVVDHSDPEEVFGKKNPWRQTMVSYDDGIAAFPFFSNDPCIGDAVKPTAFAKGHRACRFYCRNQHERAPLMLEFARSFWAAEAECAQLLAMERNDGRDADGDEKAVTESAFAVVSLLKDGTYKAACEHMCLGSFLVQRRESGTYAIDTETRKIAFIVTSFQAVAANLKRGDPVAVAYFAKPPSHFRSSPDAAVTPFEAPYDGAKIEGFPFSNGTDMVVTQEAEPPALSRNYSPFVVGRGCTVTAVDIRSHGSGGDDGAC